MTLVTRSCIVFTVLLMPVRSSAAQPPAAAIAEWNALVAGAEADIDARGRTAPAIDRQLVLSGGVDIVELPTVNRRGQTVEIPGATVQRWRGAKLIPGTTVDAVVRSLQQHPPQQPDVSASRIMWRTNGQMAVYLRLVRRMLVTVTYDTEHTVGFFGVRPGLAFSRSVMTRVHEVSNPGTSSERRLTGDEDHGFLWRLNAYWWYEDTPAGVIVVMESLTLSRDIPAAVRPFASPLVRRIASESVASALDGVRGRFE